MALAVRRHYQFSALWVLSPSLKLHLTVRSSSDLGRVLGFASLHYSTSKKMVCACQNWLTVPVPVPDHTLCPCSSLLQLKEVANTFCGYKVLNKEVRCLNVRNSALLSTFYSSSHVTWFISFRSKSMLDLVSCFKGYFFNCKPEGAMLGFVW